MLNESMASSSFQREMTALFAQGRVAFWATSVYPCMTKRKRICEAPLIERLKV